MQNFSPSDSFLVGNTTSLQTHFILEEAEAVSIDSAWGGATLFPNHSGGNSMTTVGVIQ